MDNHTNSMHIMKNALIKLMVSLVTCISLFSSQFALSAIPNNVSPAQIEQFKKLPQSQQKALAQSMGINLDTITAQINSSNAKSNNSTQAEPLTQRSARMMEESESIVEDYEDKIKGLKPFGYDVFAYEPSSFAPAMDIVVPEDYIVGPGDTLSIQLFGKENADYSFSVSREGSILLPKLGPIRVAGMTFAEVKTFINNIVKEKVIGAQVVVTLSELRSIRVFVLGDAYKPGPYVLSALSSMTHAIFSAGGINEIGSLRKVQLKRSGKLVATLDLYDLLINGDSTHDLLLKSGDVIFIPPVGKRVSIDGEVIRPAIYEITPQDTFAKVLQMSGGLLPSAFPAKSIVKRFNQKRLRTIQNVDLTNQNTLAEKVKGGDFIKVLKTSNLYQNTITLYGAVTRPGKYQWQAEQKISDLLPNIQTALLDNADLAYGLVVREKDVARNIEVYQFSMFNIATDINSADNLKLQPQDKILIFSNDNKPNGTLDFADLALTETELTYIDKSHAKEKHAEKKFWQTYDPSRNNETQANKLNNVTIEEFTGIQEIKDLNISDYNYFSRERMLAPIIDKIKRQASTGEPIQLVEVVGEVKYPGLYPLTVNNHVKGLIKAAGGLLESAYIEKADITRNATSNYKATQSRFSFDLKKALAANSSEENNSQYLLQSRDRLNVLKIPAWQENHIVELRGEFLFPGKYTISRGETLGELIERVGGYTEFAYTKASIFTRSKLKLLEKRNIEKVAENLRSEIASKSLSSETDPIDYQQIKELLSDLTKVTPLGRLVVDLPKVQKGNEYDVTLENGDLLYVPSKQNSINVVGQVQLATAHMFNSRLTLDDYIDLSGGTKSQADTDRIYVIKANGAVFVPQNSNWFASNVNHKLEPGDSIVVPTDTEYMSSIKLWQTGTQIIYNSAVALAAIASL